MPMKGDGPTQVETVDRWAGGVGWIAYPSERMQRASHVLDTEAGTYVVDPVDGKGVDDLITGFGDVAGVVVALDRHKRDSAAVARRHGVPVFVPRFMTGVPDDLDAPVERFDDTLPGSSYRAVTVVDNPFWKEVALYHPGEPGGPNEGGTLKIAEAIGTVDYYTAPGERLGVHPMLRGFPPRGSLREFSPERLLVGHGAGVASDATAALREALRGSRRNMPALYAKTVRGFLPF